MNVPTSVSNYTLHKDPAMKIVSEDAAHFYKCFYDRLQSHHNPLIKSLYSQPIPGDPRVILKGTGAVTCY